MDINDNMFDTNCSIESLFSVPDMSIRDLQIEQVKEEIVEVSIEMRGADYEIEKNTFSK